MKNKIRALRNSYTKAKKLGPSGSARRSQTKRTKWILDKLQFLDPYIAIRETVSNMDEVCAQSSINSLVNVKLNVGGGGVKTAIIWI